MSVREALDALLATHTGEVMTHDGRFVPDCDPDKLADLIDALAALREQAGVGEVARAIFAGRYGPGNEALWKIERWSYERDARAALRALGLEDA